MSYIPHDAVVVRPGQDLTALALTLPASNVRIYLADGTHTLSDTLVLSGKSNWSIEGGPNAILAINAPVSQTMIQLINCTDVTFQGFQVSGVGTVRIFQLNTVTRLRFLNLTVNQTNGFATGWVFDVTGVGAITDAVIRGCVFSGVLDYVFWCSPVGAASVVRLKVSGNQLSSTIGTTLVSIAGATASVTDCIVSDNTVSTAGSVWNSGVANVSNIIIRANVVTLGAIGGFSNSPTRVVIEGNVVATVQINGLSFTGGTDIVVRNNCFTGGTSWTIACASLNRFTITGNKFFTVATGGVDAFRIYDCNNGVISANVIVSAGRYGIQFTGAVGNSNIIVDGNEFRTNANSDIVFGTVPSVRMIVSNNSFYRNVAGDAIVIQAVATFTDCVIRGNTFDIPASNAIFMTSGTRVNIIDNHVRAPVASGVRLDSCTFCNVNNNSVDAAGVNGLRFDACTDLVVDGNRLGAAGATTAIDLLNACVRIIINGNRMVTVGGNGINAANLTYSVIRSNKICAGVAVGIYLAAGCDNNVVGGNEVQSPTSHGIHSLGAYVNITGNKVHLAGGNGILVAEDNTLVAGNTCTSCTGDGIRVDGGAAVINININGNYCGGNGSDGIELVDTDESLVQSNRCYNNTGYGINQDANSDQDLVSSNHVRGNTAGALNLLGTNLTNVNNKV